MGMLIGTVCTVPVAAVEWATAPVRMDGPPSLQFFTWVLFVWVRRIFFGGKVSLFWMPASAPCFIRFKPMISVLLGALFLGRKHQSMVCNWRGFDCFQACCSVS